jgi:hypothetical protein
MLALSLPKCGEGEIRTREPLRVTRFPSARTRPTMRPLQKRFYYNQNTPFLQERMFKIFTGGF